MNNLSFEWSHKPQKFSWISCPNLSLFDNNVVLNYSTSSNKGTFLESGAFNSSPHSNESSVVYVWALNNWVWPNEYMITDVNTPWNMNSVLDYAVAPYFNTLIAQQSGSIPNWGLFAGTDITNNCGVRSNEVRLL